MVGNTCSLFHRVRPHRHQRNGIAGARARGRCADAFAAVIGLKMGTALSQGVLIEAAKGWFYSDRRDKREGNKIAFYDEHGIDKQRAYNVVCLMVGSDPEKFKGLAEATKLPEERQATCVGDYSNASWSWDTVLKPHRRAPDQPKTEIGVSYQEGKGKLAVFADAFRRVRMLETVAERASDSFAWRAPFALEMQSCGESNAHWDIPVRKIIVCYEIADEFAQLYLTTAKSARRKRQRVPPDAFAHNQSKKRTHTTVPDGNRLERGKVSADPDFFLSLRSSRCRSVCAVALVRIAIVGRRGILRRPASPAGRPLSR